MPSKGQLGCADIDQVWVHLNSGPVILAYLHDVEKPASVIVSDKAGTASQASSSSSLPEFPSNDDTDIESVTNVSGAPSVAPSLTGSANVEFDQIIWSRAKALAPSGTRDKSGVWEENVAESAEHKANLAAIALAEQAADAHFTLLAKNNYFCSDCFAERSES